MLVSLPILWWKRPQREGTSRLHYHPKFILRHFESHLPPCPVLALPMYWIRSCIIYVPAALFLYEVNLPGFPLSIIPNFAILINVSLTHPASQASKAWTFWPSSHERESLHNVSAFVPFFNKQKHLLAICSPEIAFWSWFGHSNLQLQRPIICLMEHNWDELITNLYGVCFLTWMDKNWAHLQCLSA